MGAGEDIMKRLDAIEAKLDQVLARGAGSGGGAAVAAIAPDSDLDGEHGDEEIKRAPKRWTGESHVGRRLSECDPAFLDCLAEFKDWAIGKDEEKMRAATNEEDKKKADKSIFYSRKTAARCRGWAARLRAGWKRPAPPPVNW